MSERLRREVEVHRCDRHLVLTDRPEIGSLFELASLVRQLDPVIGKIALVDAADRPEGPGQPAALTGDPRAADLFRWDVRKVDVDEAPRLPVAGEQPLENRRRKTASSGPVDLAANLEDLAQCNR